MAGGGNSKERIDSGGSAPVQSASFLPPGVLVGAGIVLVAVDIFRFFDRRRTQKFSAPNLPPQGPNSNLFDSPLWHEQQNASPLADYGGFILPNSTPPLGMPVSVPTYSSSTSNSLGSDKPFPPHSPGIRCGMLLIKFT